MPGDQGTYAGGSLYFLGRLSEFSYKLYLNSEARSFVRINSQLLKLAVEAILMDFLLIIGESRI
jgi:hypothetical protein